MLLGAAVGDALGWPQEQNSGIVGGNRNRDVDPSAEFRDWVRYSGSQYQKYIDPVAAGEYSDDTQLILATARAIQTDDWFATLTDTELPLFLLYQRGAGGATLRACRSWATGLTPWAGGTTQRAQKAQRLYFSAGGNGVAMRIAPHAIACAAEPRSELVSRVVRDGIATHGHPRALVGAAAYAVALHLLLTVEGTLEYGELAGEVSADTSWQQPEIAFRALPESWVDVASQGQPDLAARWDTAVREVLELLSASRAGTKSGILGNDIDVLEGLGCFDKKINGAGTVSSVGAIYLASRNAPRPMSGLLRAAYLKNADSDTMASMTCALLGALHGPDWLGGLTPWLQDRTYVEQLADRCTSLALGEQRVEPAPRQVRDQDLVEFRSALVHGHVRTLPDGRDITEIRAQDLESRTKARVRRWILHVNSQTMTIDSVDRRTSNTRDNTSPAESVRAVGPPSATLGRISLLAPDLDAIESFYGTRGLGLKTYRAAPNEIHVGKVLRFVQAGARNDVRGQPTLFDIQVDDLDALVDRFGVSLTDSNSLRVKDPAGNDVWITQAKM
nr:ADP-ribosylglycohydrolase family protein [Rhodococcus wratislaviensis]